MAAVEAGPILRMVLDFIWLRVLNVGVVKKKWLPGVTRSYQELPGVTRGYQAGNFNRREAEGVEKRRK